MRAYLNEHPFVTTIALILVMLCGIWGIWNRGGVAVVEGRCWYLEESSGTVFMRGLDEIPPIVGPSGGSSVRVQVYRCRDGERFVAWLEKYSVGHKRVLDKMRENKASGVAGFDIVDSTIEVRMRGLGGEWVSPSSQMGKGLISNTKKRCKYAKIVYPKRADDLLEDIDFTLR